MTVEQQQDMDNNNIITDDGNERKPSTIKFNPLPKHAQNNKKHKRVKPPKMDDEQKKLAQARIDKQMNEGFEKIFFQKMLEICKEGGPKRVVPTGEEGKTKARASLEEVKEFAVNYVKHAPPLPPKAELPAGKAMRHALMYYYGFDFVEGTIIPPIKYGECNWDEGIPHESAHRVFIDAFRMRVEDELVFANNVHGNAKDVKLGTIKFGPQARNDFATFLRKARKGVNGQPTMLPSWWKKEDDKICEGAEILHERFQKADAKALYGEEFQNLRVLAELVLGTPIGAGIPYEADFDIFKDKQGVYWHDVDPSLDTVPKPPSKGKQVDKKELSKERIKEELDYVVKGRK